MYIFTQEGVEKIKQRLNYLKKIRFYEITKAIRDAISSGGIQENGAYEDAREKQILLQQEISELEKELRQGKIVEKKSKMQNIVQIGSDVLVLFGGEMEKFHIVGRAMADAFKRQISYQSPLGRALLGKSTGEEASYKVGERIFKCKVLSVDN